MFILPVALVIILACKIIYDRTGEGSVLNGIASMVMATAFHMLFRSGGAFIVRVVFGRIGRDASNNPLTAFLSSALLVCGSVAAAFYTCEEVKLEIEL